MSFVEESDTSSGHQIGRLLNNKTLFLVVFLVALVEGAFIYFSQDLSDRISLPMYSFYDSENGLITAEGAWVSTEDLAFPLSTVTIECWKQFGHCWIADATIMDFDSGSQHLSSGLELEEIAMWSEDYIETKPSKPLSGCVEEVYRLDRRSQVVTYTRRTVLSKGVCEGVSEKPIVAKLGNGYERLMKE